MAELNQIYAPVSAAGRSRIVFIHGLDGDYRLTWMSNKNDDTTLWPKWLGQDIGCPVWLLGYGAAMSRWKADAMAIPRQATAVLECLSAEPAMLEGPLILIGHSLGGLIIKSALNQGMRRDTARHKRLVENIKGIAFVGTPHFGSKWASLTSALRFIRSNPQVTDLGIDNAHLEELNQLFLPLLKELSIKTRVYFETEPLRLPGLLGRILPAPTIVSPTSSQPHIPGEPGTGVEGNHITICKPLNRKAGIYTSILAFVREVEATATPQTLDAHGSVGAMGSERVEAISPEDRQSPSVHLAFATYGFTLTTAAGASVITSVCLVTDAQERLRRTIDEIRLAIKSDPLVPEKVKLRATASSLADLVRSPATRSIALRTLAVTSFSSYLYYCPEEVFNGMSDEERVQRLIVNPLVHRLSKKGEHVEQLHTKLAGADVYVKAVADEIERMYHRTPIMPRNGDGKFTPIEEIASLLAVAASEHLADIKSGGASELFESLRTRIRYGENIATGEKHKRDMNPLP